MQKNTCTVDILVDSVSDHLLHSLADPRVKHLRRRARDRALMNYWMPFKRRAWRNYFLTVACCTRCPRKSWYQCDVDVFVRASWDKSVVWALLLDPMNLLLVHLRTSILQRLDHFLNFQDSPIHARDLEMASRNICQLHII